jgi:glycyl-tRNA synthetase
METSMKKIVALAKNRGFVYAGSEIYGGLANAWDYARWASSSRTTSSCLVEKFVQENPYNVGVDCAILMNPQVWVASGTSVIY